AGLTGSWLLLRSAVVPVESPGCQRHPQLAWTSTNSRAEPLKQTPGGTDDRFLSSVNILALRAADRPRKAMVCPTNCADDRPRNTMVCPTNCGCSTLSA